MTLDEVIPIHLQSCGALAYSLNDHKIQAIGPTGRLPQWGFAAARGGPSTNGVEAIRIRAHLSKVFSYTLADFGGNRKCVQRGLERTGIPEDTSVAAQHIRSLVIVGSGVDKAVRVGVRTDACVNLDDIK